jgi:hypothetical protein
MADSPNSLIQADERATIFHEQYGNDIDAGSTLAEIITAAGNYLSRIVGAADADAGMARMVRQVVNAAVGGLKDDADWRKALDESSSSCFSELAFGARLHNLAAYAVYGIVLDCSETAEERAKNLEELVREAAEFLQATPTSQWGISLHSDLHRLVRLATNRWALDNGRPIEPAALAEFGRVTEGRIRNMMSGQKRAFSSVDGGIPAQEALAWLNDRSEFWSSIWRDQSLPQYGVKHRPALKQAVFVPVARDGTTFHPGLKRGAGYAIGEKGAEIQVADFDQALEDLQRMPTPYWRRPNEVGNWGIVAGVRWVRMDSSDLEAIAGDPNYRIPENLRA